LRFFDIIGDNATVPEAWGMDGGEDDTPQPRDAAVTAEKDDVKIFYATPFPKTRDEIHSLDAEALATEVLTTTDPRRAHFADAIKKEFTGLAEKRVFEERVIPKHARSDLDILKSRYVLAIKNPGTTAETKKARLVVTAIRRLDKGSRDLFTYSPTTTKASTRLLFSISASMRTRLFTRDISQAYVCSKFDLLRDVYIVPPKEAHCHPDILWKLTKPLYGLPESGNLWYKTYLSHNVTKLCLTCTALDPCLLYRHKPQSDNKASAMIPDAYGQTFDRGKSLEALLCIQVDDTCATGSEAFLEEEEQESVVFPSKGRTMIEEKSVKFNGSDISRVERQGTLEIVMSQDVYIASLPIEPTPRTAVGRDSSRTGRLRDQ
jgi:Reverse transcriptase (RNA-dependent DNA polymerase)